MCKSWSKSAKGKTHYTVVEGLRKVMVQFDAALQKFGIEIEEQQKSAKTGLPHYASFEEGLSDISMFSVVQANTMF